MTTPVLLLVSGFPLWNYAVKTLLHDHLADVSFLEVKTAIEAAKLIKEKQVDAVVMLPVSLEENWMEALTRMLSNHNLPILMMGKSNNLTFIVRMLQSGASGYISYPAEVKELVNAVQRVIKNERFISSDLAEQIVINQIDEKNEDPHHFLSNREYQVMIELAKGKKLKEIADSNFLSDKSISTYRSRILKKLGLENNYQLIRYALQHGLID